MTWHVCETLFCSDRVAQRRFAIEIGAQFQGGVGCPASGVSESGGQERSRAVRPCTATFRWQAVSVMARPL